LIELLINSIN